MSQGCMQLCTHLLKSEHVHSVFSSWNALTCMSVYVTQSALARSGEVCNSVMVLQICNPTKHDSDAAPKAQRVMARAVGFAWELPHFNCSLPGSSCVSTKGMQGLLSVSQVPQVEAWVSARGEKQVRITVVPSHTIDAAMMCSLNHLTATAASGVNDLYAPAQQNTDWNPYTNSCQTAALSLFFGSPDDINSQVTACAKLAPC